MHVWPSPMGLEQSASCEELLQRQAWFRCDDNKVTVHLNTTTAAPKEVSIAGAIASLMSDLENISFFKEE